MVHCSSFFVVALTCLASSIQYANILLIVFCYNNLLQMIDGALGGLHFALEEDVMEWLETSKVARLMPTISFQYSSSLLNFS